MKQTKGATMKMKDKVVRRISSGELFIETKPRDWQARLEALQADNSNPSPMPVGHLMFRYPADYGCALVSDQMEQAA
jgi:hypothetical protein